MHGKAPLSAEVAPWPSLAPRQCRVGQMVGGQGMRDGGIVTSAGGNENQQVFVPARAAMAIWSDLYRRTGLPVGKLD